MDTRHLRGDAGEDSEHRPHSHGAHVNNVPINRDEVTLASVLRDAGYHTVYAVKQHLDNDGRPGWISSRRSMGLHNTRYMFNRGHCKKIPEPGALPSVHPYDDTGLRSTYTMNRLTDKTIAFLRARQRAPFCFMLSIPDPDQPLSVRAPYETMYDPDEMPVPSTLFEENLPEWAESARRASDYYTEDRRQRHEKMRNHKLQY